MPNRESKAFADNILNFHAIEARAAAESAVGRRPSGEQAAAQRQCHTL